MPGRVQDKVAIVTGSSSGLGRAIALALSAEGARVVCADLQPSARVEISGETNVNTHDLIKQQGGNAVFVKVDVGVTAEMEALVEAAVAEFGRLDVMVNNAGIAIESKKSGRIHETDEETWDKTMLINSKSVFLGCKYAIRQMLAQEPHQSGHRGWIINLSSIYGLVAAAKTPSYSASKGAVSNLTRQVAIDYGPDKIHCNAICPGHVQTAIFEHTKHRPEFSMEYFDQTHPLGGAGTPDDIAGVAVFLASDDAKWMTGACVPVDGGFTAR